MIGNKAFYKMALMVAVPIMIQNGITNFVSLLDNIMVGRIGTEQMSGVAIVNQLLLVFRLSVFGAISGAGIFGAQFYGRGNHEGVKDTMRFKMILGIGISLIAAAAFLIGGESLIGLFLEGGGDVGDVERTLHYGRQYLYVMLLELVPFAVAQTYASTLRECGETVLPMKAGLAAVALNLIGNYLLIFGVGFFPVMGVAGAAVATVVSRFVECAIIIGWVYRHKEKAPYSIGLRRGFFSIPGALVRDMIVKGTPLLINEFLWSGGMAMLTQCYSVRGLSVVAALNISNTIVNVFTVVFLSMGNAVSIIVGQLLGAGKMEEAKEKDYKLIAFSMAISVLVGALLILISPLFPQIYDTQPEVRELASNLIRVSAVCMPLISFVNAAYFTLRSGGKTIITFVFDSAYIWVVSIPLAYSLSRFTGLPIVPLYFACQAVDIVKCVIGFILVKKGVWLHNIVNTKMD